MTCLESERNKEWSRLVYWYGSNEGSPESYSLLNGKDVISYEDGCENKYHKISRHLQQKIKRNMLLTEDESLKIRGLELMTLDVEKGKKDRKHHWVFNVFEDDVLSFWGSELRAERSIFQSDNFEVDVGARREDCSNEKKKQVSSTGEDSTMKKY